MRHPVVSELETLESRRLFSAAPVPHPDHVVIVVEENHSYAQVLGSPNAPYINSLAGQGASLTEYHALTHPSQPNYIALFSGSRQGVSDDSVPHTFSAPSLGGQLIDAGLGFAGFSESLPSVGFEGASSGAYRRKHAPWVNFTDVSAGDNLPFSAFPADAAGFARLPAVSFVIPDQRHDMHDGTVRQADDWLKAWLDPYVHWAATHNGLLVVTWDEDGRNTPDNHVPAILVGQPVKTGKYAGAANHYSLLRTVQDMFGLKPLGHAEEASPITGIWSTTVPASADGYVRDGTPTTRYGAATTLHVKTKSGSAGLNRDAYLKFDTGAGAGALASAKLRLYGALSSPGRVATSLFSVPDTGWSESTLAWNHRPTLGPRLGTVTVGSTSYGWYELDVTNYVNAERARGHRTVSFGLHNPTDSSAEVLFHSREAAANRPVLVLNAL